MDETAWQSISWGWYVWKVVGYWCDGGEQVELEVWEIMSETWWTSSGVVSYKPKYLEQVMNDDGKQVAFQVWVHSKF